MHIEAILAAVASVVSAGVIVRMVHNQLRDSYRVSHDKARIVSAMRLIRKIHDMHDERINNLTITVTNNETNDSVQLPPHYDRKAVSKFIEMTA